MKVLFVSVLVAHGLIHLLGFAKAFRLAAISQLTQAIPRSVGALWLLCALSFIAAGLLVLRDSGEWWWVAAPTLVLSQVLIALSWRDAKFGTLANIVILIPLVVSMLDALPSSYGGRYRAVVRDGLSRHAEMTVVKEADIGRLPGPVQRYLRYTGTVGKPRVHHVRAVFSGEMKRAPSAGWMTIRVEQYDFLDRPERVFLMKARRFGVPFDALHLFREGAATMQVKVASLVEVVDARGPLMNQGETVTLLNDLCVLAPSFLLDERIQWEDAGPLAARARFTHEGVTVTALLQFNDGGELVDFASDDRYLSTDGKSYTRYRWSTPVRDYRNFAGRKVATYGEAIWHTPDGELTYAKFHLVELDYDRVTLD